MVKHTSLTLTINGYPLKVSLRPKSSRDATIIADYYLPNGKRRRVSTRTRDMAEARRWVINELNVKADMQRALEDHAPKSDLGSSNPSISELCDYYTGIYLPNKNAKPRTIQQARQILRDFELYCRCHHIGRTLQLGRRVLDGHAAELRARGRQPKTISNALGMIRACLNACVEGEVIKEAPVKRWLMPTVPDPEIDPLEPEQLARVLAIIERSAPAIYNAVRWIAWTGNRPSDMRTLKWPHVDLKAQVVARAQEKTRRLARYQINDQALAALMAEKKRGMPGPKGEVFTDEDGRPFNRNRVFRLFARTLEQAKFERHVTLKDLRHTFGYIMANYVKCPLPVVQQLMGHRRIETTLRYVRPGDAGADLAQFEKVVYPGSRKRK